MVRTNLDPSAKRLLVRLCLGAGIRVPQLARDSAIGERTIYRAKSIWLRTGQVHRKAQFPGRRRSLNIDRTQYVLGLITLRPDMYLQEIRRDLFDTFGLSVSDATIWRTLRRAGYTYKQSSKRAVERDSMRRAAYISRIGLHYSPEQLVFVDESACDRRTTYRRHAWAYRGDRAVRYAHFVRGKRYSILPALSLDGILDVTVILGSYTEQKFIKFIEEVLMEMNPFPGKNSVLIMDNCAIHKSARLRELIEEKGMRLEFLPGYSPDFNPIELAFSAIKAWIRSHDDWVRQEMEKGISEAIQALIFATFTAVTLEKAGKWFERAGYGRCPILDMVASDSEEGSM